jgi:hypothetical protein
MESLEGDTLLDRRTVRASLKWLTEAGLIEDTGARKGDTGRITVYALNVNGSKSTKNGTIEQSQEPADFITDEGSNGDKNGPIEQGQKRPHSLSLNGDVFAVQSGHFCSAPIYEGRVLKGKRTRALRSTPSETDVSGGALFSRFWESYPRQEGEKAARRAFAKLNPDEALVERMLATLEAQRTSPAWTEAPRFIPHAATWLKDERWNDVVASANDGEPSDAGFDTRGDCDKRAAEVGLDLWDEIEPWAKYKARVIAAVKQRQH